MKKIKIGLLAAVFGTSLTVNAQGDIHHSMFYATPTMLNPATAGAFNADMRAFTNYRTQWGSITPNQFRTITASFDAPIRPKSTGASHFGAGLNFYNDKAGDGQVTTNNFQLTGSYVLEVDKGAYLSFGAGLGLIQRSIAFVDLYWDNQWNGETFDQSVYSGEAGFTDKFQAFDVSAGLFYYADYGGGLKFEAGASISHFNRPNVTFLGKNDPLLMKVNIHSNATIPIPDSKIDILPGVLVMFQGPNRLINVGTDIKYLVKRKSERLSFNDEVSISLGTYFRFQDAAYFTTRFNYGPFSLGAAFDLTLSELSTYNSNMGGLEFFLQYVVTLGQSGGVSMFR